MYSLDLPTLVIILKNYDSDRYFKTTTGNISLNSLKYLGTKKQIYFASIET